MIAMTLTRTLIVPESFWKGVIFLTGGRYPAEANWIFIHDV